MKKEGLIFIISGPSGSGKTTLAERILKLKEFKARVVKSVSMTTRPKRSREKENRDYIFVSAKEFKAKLAAKKILEWTRYLGYYYGTPKDFVDAQRRQAKHILMCLDLKGALRVKQLYPKNTVTIFVIPPSLNVLKERICKRCAKTTKEEVIERLRLAKSELTQAKKYDYCAVNDDLSRVVREVKNIIKDNIRKVEYGIRAVGKTTG